MRTLRRTALLVVAALFSFQIAACGGEPSAPSRPATVQVSVQTTGGDFDDGYEVTVGDQHRLLGSNAGAAFSVPPGRVTIQLSRIDANCSVVGENPRIVDVESGKTVPVGFVVACATTGVQIFARTTGSDMPSHYAVTVGIFTRQLPINGSVVVSRLAPGAYPLSIVFPRDNCALTGVIPSSIVVTNRNVTAVNLDVLCAAVVRPERIAYSIDSIPSAGVLFRRLAVANPNGSGEVRLENGHSPSWAPDGKSLPYSNADCSYSFYYYYYCGGGIVVIDPETGAVRFISSGSVATSPAWSPTGDVIAYNDLGNDRLFLISPEGGGKTQVVVPGVNRTRNAAWSPDGQRLAISCSAPVEGFDICTVKRDGTGYLQLTSETGIEDDPAWSPDGSRIAFSMQGPTGSASRDIAIVPAGGGSIRRVTEGFDPAWSRDGTKLIFARVDGLFSINPDGTNLTRITTGSHRDPAWRP